MPARRSHACHWQGPMFNKDKNEENSMAFGFDDGEVDVLYTKAINIVIEQQKVSTSYIQRYLQIHIHHIYLFSPSGIHFVY